MTMTVFPWPTANVMRGVIEGRTVPRQMPCARSVHASRLAIVSASSKPTMEPRSSTPIKITPALEVAKAAISFAKSRA